MRNLQQRLELKAWDTGTHCGAVNYLGLDQTIVLEMMMLKMRVPFVMRELRSHTFDPTLRIDDILAGLHRTIDY
jgi:hypothetical protein